MTGRRESELAAHGFYWEEGLHFPLTKKETAAVVAAALQEDDAKHDITTAATVLSDRRARCRLVARQPVGHHVQERPDDGAEERSQHSSRSGTHEACSVPDAARNGRVDVIRRFLAAGADVNARESLRGTTALMWAAEQRHPDLKWSVRRQSGSGVGHA